MFKTKLNPHPSCRAPEGHPPQMETLHVMPGVGTSMKDMLTVIANEPLCPSEAVGDNQPLL